MLWETAPALFDVGQQGAEHARFRPDTLYLADDPPCRS